MLPVTDEFRRELKKWVDAKRGRVALLARELDIDHKLISALIAGNVKNSAAVRLISRQIGITPPSADGLDPDFAEALTRLREKSPSIYRSLLRHAQELAGDPDDED